MTNDEGMDGDELVTKASSAYLELLKGMPVHEAALIIHTRILANAELHGRMLEEIANYAERQAALLEQIATALEGRRPDLK